MGDIAALAALALSAFTSATLLPGTSEAALVGLLALGETAAWLAILVATVANVAGSAVNWGIGRYLVRFRDHPRFPVSRERYARTEALYRRWGVASLLLSWTPIVGDPLTVVAGVMRTPLLLFLPIVVLAKGGRYVAVAALAEGLL
ncbi:YqaA family protein [Salinarimonas ramus]|uniref:Membrane protein n=1 Tax=Salinarimonas ramus TaxID=690164 RepID=A0A917V6B6_9HYPH|nr:YqaA family protein [Salinarimonas ramus]GGK44025.1 membrane protein [Salinarimonas ramus]